MNTIVILLLFILSGLAQAQDSTITSNSCYGGDCSDGTISVKYNGNYETQFEGKCGQVAAANLLSMSCNTLFTANEFDNVSWDYTPGTRPSTLRDIVNTVIDDQASTHCQKIKGYKLIQEQVKFHESDFVTQSDYINLLYSRVRFRADKNFLVSRVKVSTTRNAPELVGHHQMYDDTYTRTEEVLSVVNPVISCISSNGLGHYVTIVDVTNVLDKYRSCKVIYNQFGKQYTEDCMSFAKKAKLVGGVSANITSYFCGRYNVFSLQKTE